LSEHDHAHGEHDEGEHHDLPVAARVRRLEERLIAAGLASDEEIDAYLGKLYASASPVNGARMAARAWTDNVIVCTLCSCYPVSLLGPSPGWYKSFAYRSRTVREPRSVLEEFGVALPDDARISVWDSTSEARYMVLPVRPAGTSGLTAEELAGLVTLNGLIGTAPV
jgi:nitrile hydratase